MLTRRRLLINGCMAPIFGIGLSSRALRAADFPGLITRMTEPENLEFPFPALSDFIVPNEKFFIRSHFAVPKIDEKSWKLTVEGAVNQKLELSYDDLRKLPSRKLTAALECAGNGRVFLKPASNGLQWGQGAVGNAEWTGVPLAAVLEKAGLKDSAIEVILEGTDTGQINSDPKSPGTISFARSLPIAKARHESVLLAYEMNGDLLPASHGFPLRAIVGGWYGMASVKWLRRIIVTDKAFQGFFQTLDYAIWDRKDGLPTLVPVTKIDVKAAIARPSLGEVIPAGKPYRVFGAAWAGESAIAKVEVSTDGGRRWAEAELLDKPAPLTWCRWEHKWHVNDVFAPARIMARATDADGRVQAEERDINRRNYMISHVVPIDVMIK